MSVPKVQSELRASLSSLETFFKRAAFFSFFTNILVLAPTGYMMEVYDRVVNSRNHLTLAMLTLLVLLAYAVMEMLEWVRSEFLHRASLKLDAKLNERIFNAVFRARLHGHAGGVQAFSDLRALRDFLASPAMTAVLDVPIAALLLILIFMIHPLMGVVSLVGAVILAFLAFITERRTQKPMAEANMGAVGAQNYANNSLRNAEVIEAMGMLGSIHRRWMEKQRNFLRMQAVASDHAGLNGALSKLVQTTQSSALLGLGVWLSIKGDLNGSSSLIIVASIIGGRAVAPIVQVITLWKQIVSARDAYVRLDNLLEKVPERQAGMPLPSPKGVLAVEAVTAAPPGSNVPIVRGMNFTIPAGDVVAVIGPSASGKSSLARLMVGIWPTLSGKVRLDGADVYAWNKSELGPHIGYLPQDVELFDGSLAENIARFGEVDMAKVEDAARMVGVHDFILGLPQGYETDIGDDGVVLSGGQRQRIGLARAVYGVPRFVVLDEPNSSLDEAGEQALLQTLRWLNSQQSTVVVITHRTSVLPVVDRILIVRDGGVQAYGPRDEVLAALARGQNPQAQQAPVPAAVAAPMPAQS